MFKGESNDFQSCATLGIPHSHVTVCRFSNLRDAMDSIWEASVVARLVLKHVEMLNIDTLLTFDEHGRKRLVLIE